jgi:hypothetical protein
MPDPILNLADFAHAETFTLSGQKGRVIPQVMEAGSSRHHTRLFYVEYPVQGGQVYQIDTSRLAAISGDGAISRSFTAAATARFLAASSRHYQPHALLKAISI